MYPPFLFDVSRTGYVSVTDPTIIQQCEATEARILRGEQRFGFPVVLPSFAPPERNSTYYRMPAVVQGLLILRTLFSAFVMHTATGMVSVWPLQVYTTEEDRCHNQHGYPVLAVPRSTLKVIVKSCYSALREVVTVANFDIAFREVMCRWSPLTESSVLLALTGMDAYQVPQLNAVRGFVLLPFGWLHVMKHVIMHPDRTLMDWSTIFQRVYHHIPECWFDNGVHKFDNRFRIAWLGSERPLYVDAVLHEPHIHHTEAMKRNRAFNGIIRRGPTGPVWLLPPAIKAHQRIQYHALSFGFGVRCFDHQLTSLNDAWRAFSDVVVVTPATPVFHLHSLLQTDTITPVGSREDSIQRGLTDDVQLNRQASNTYRRRKYALCKTYGAHFVTHYWGIVKPLYRSGVDSKNNNSTKNNTSKNNNSDVVTHACISTLQDVTTQDIPVHDT
jgi:hypothetical protein